MSLQIRLMREQDIAAVFEVQTQAYVSAMVEVESIFPHGWRQPCYLLGCRGC
jgi:hypothetical protein